MQRTLCRRFLLPIASRPMEYDYPDFHLIMHCYLCSLLMEALHLNEHEAARWLSKDELDSVKWLPADLEVIKALIEG